MQAASLYTKLSMLSGYLIPSLPKAGCILHRNARYSGSPYGLMITIKLHKVVLEHAMRTSTSYSYLHTFPSRHFLLDPSKISSTGTRINITLQF